MQQYSGCIQVGKGSGWSWIHQVIGWDSRAYPKFHNRTQQYSPVGESSGQSWIHQVISQDMHGLHRGNRSLLGCGNTFFPRSEMKEVLGVGEARNSNTGVCGGSFVQLKTRATSESPSRLMLLVSIISWYKSLPSQVNSLIPTNIEKTHVPLQCC